MPRQERVLEDYCIKFILMSIDNMIYSQNCIPVGECFLAAPFRRRINENWEVTLWLTRPPRNRLCANRLRFN